jgi:hypothetical protein
MFETEIHEGSFLSYVLQQASVCLGSVIWALLTIDHIPEGSSAREALYIVSLSFGVPLVFSSGIWYRFQGPADAAKRVWILPSALLLAMLLSSLVHGQLGRDIPELLFPPPHEGEAWWAVLFATYPTLGCLGYSLGAYLGTRSYTRESH